MPCCGEKEDQISPHEKEWTLSRRVLQFVNIRQMVGERYNTIAVLERLVRMGIYTCITCIRAGEGNVVDTCNRNQSRPDISNLVN